MLRPQIDGGPVQDGFMYNTYLKPNLYEFLAADQMDTLRRATSYRPKMVNLPDDFGRPIAAYDTFQYEASINPGSWIWGIALAEFSSTGVLLATGNLSIRLTDACTGIPLFSDFMLSGGLSPYDPAEDPRGAQYPLVLPHPILVLEPGRILVEIANQGTSASYGQALLLIAEPDIIRGAEKWT